MIKVKICGITNLDDAKAAVGAGCDALGFVFYRNSPRYILPERAKKIIALLPARTVKIGVFVNAPIVRIRHIAKLCRLDMVQLHGNESPRFCALLKGHRIIKAIQVRNKKLQREDLQRYKVFAYLFDSATATKLGGTGKTFNWKFLPHPGDLNIQVFLSGGLTRKNVRNAIKQVHPHWVDACSSVESAPGRKDIGKVKEFIRAAKGVRG